MNAQEKRAEQLKSLGIEEAEISTNVIQSTGGKKSQSHAKRHKQIC